MTTKKYRKKLKRELREAYVSLDAAKPYVQYYENELHRRIGYYYGLRWAYAQLTGKTESQVGQEVVSWYVRSEHYEREPE